MTQPQAADPNTRILLIRHGQSTSNAGEPTSDNASIPLTALGHQQAAAFAQSIPFPPTLILVSPFLRAMQTAEYTLRRFPRIPNETWPIQECTYLAPDPLAGMTDRQRSPYAARYWKLADPTHRDGPGAETFTEFLDRVRAAITRLHTLAPAQSVLVFTHGFVMQAFRLMLAFPQAADAHLMANLTRFNTDHPILNLETIALTLADGQLHLPAGDPSAAFRLAPAVRDT